MRLGSVARPQELRVVLWNFNEVISSQSQDRVQFTWSASANQRPRTAFYSQKQKMTECRYFVAVKIWDRQSCVSNQWPDTLILTNQNSANEWKFPESDQTALIVLLSAWIVRKQPKISEAAMWWHIIRCHLSPPGPHRPVCPPGQCTGCSGGSGSPQRTDGWDSCWAGREQTWKQRKAFRFFW